MRHTFSRNQRLFEIETSTLSAYEIFPGLLGFTPRRQRIGFKSHQLKSMNLYNEWKEKTSIRDHEHHWFILNISHDCNMSCSYCFANNGTYQSTSIMSSTTAKLAIDWIVNTSLAKTYTIQFFGGEPLMNEAALYESIPYALSKARQFSKRLEIHISTNGTIGFLPLGEALRRNPHKITVSLDGPPSLQNVNRPLKGNGQSYDLVTRNVRDYIELYGASHISARATWQAKKSNLIDVAETLSELGFHQFAIGRVTSSTNSDRIDNPAALIGMFESYLQLAGWYVEQLNRGKSFKVQPLYSLMHSILHSRISRFPCRVGIRKWCITPDGSIFPCHRFVGEKKYFLGNLLEIQFANDRAKELSKRVASLPSICNKCWAKYWCYSDCCDYLGLDQLDFRQEKGFCREMRTFIENLCFHLSDLSSAAKKNFPLQSVRY